MSQSGAPRYAAPGALSWLCRPNPFTRRLRLCVYSFRVSYSKKAALWPPPPKIESQELKGHAFAVKIIRRRLVALSGSLSGRSGAVAGLSVALLRSLGGRERSRSGAVRSPAGVQSRSGRFAGAAPGA